MFLEYGSEHVRPYKFIKFSIQVKKSCKFAYNLHCIQPGPYCHSFKENEELCDILQKTLLKNVQVSRKMFMKNAI